MCKLHTFIYIYIYIHTHAVNVHACTNMHTPTQNTQTCRQECKHTHTHACMYTHMHACTYACMHTHTHNHSHKERYRYTHTYTHKLTITHTKKAHAHTHSHSKKATGTHTHTHTHTHASTHTHTDTLPITRREADWTVSGLTSQRGWSISDCPDMKSNNTLDTCNIKHSCHFCLRASIWYCVQITKIIIYIYTILELSLIHISEPTRPP